MNCNKILELVQSGATVSEDQVEQMIAESDPQLHKQFFAGCNDSVSAIEKISEGFVKKYLNNPDQTAVPIRRKTKFLLILNNIALDRKYRNAILGALGDMDSIFEDAMKREGTMPFDSELGRMSEHVLVLLMRVTNFKFKAAQVLEFAENNTQFAVQLLLAILLKEPAYELELRVNCISGLLGFTQPHAFFNPNEKIEMTGCGKFNEKVDFIANLMLRLSAIQVVNDVLTPHIMNVTGPAMPPLLHVGVTHMMRCTMNIFNFASAGNTKWRQHILVSTSFVDGASTLYLQSQVRHLASLFNNGSIISRIPDELLSGIATSLKFISFSTFHMGKYGRCLRPLCHFAAEIPEINGFAKLLAPTSPYALLSSLTVVNWLHMLCNIDALAGDEEITEEEGEDALSDELTSDALKQAIVVFVAAVAKESGPAAVEGLQKRFEATSGDSLIAHDCTTFAIIKQILSSTTSATTTTTAATTTTTKAVEQQPTAATNSNNNTAKSVGPAKVSTAQADSVTVEHNFGNVTTAPSQTGANRFLCALTGNTMKNPVTSPYGHTFEKEVIEQWLRQKGNVCPFTGKPLNAAELKPNKELQNEIMQQVILQTMQQASNYEDESDMYDF